MLHRVQIQNPSRSSVNSPPSLSHILQATVAPPLAVPVWQGVVGVYMGMVGSPLVPVTGRRLTNL